MTELLVVGPDNTTGFRKHLEETANLFSKKKSVFHPIHTRGDEQLQELVDYQAKLTLIGGRNWIKRNTHILNELPGKTGLLVAGPLGQNEISGIEIENLVYFMKLLDEGKTDYIFLGCPHLTDRIDNEKVIYTPAPMVKELKKEYTKPFPKRNIVSILNDNAPHKNTLNSLAGISLSKKTDELIVNGLPTDHLYLAEKYGLNPILNNTEKLPLTKYRSTIQESKLILHLSYSEGLCYGALEALYRHTPVLVTTAMPWFDHPLLTVQNPSDHYEIANRMDTILEMDKNKYRDLGRTCRYIANNKILENNTVAKNNIEGILDSI